MGVFFTRNGSVWASCKGLRTSRSPPAEAERVWDVTLDGGFTARSLLHMQLEL
jgi:hypothetical protein